MNLSPIGEACLIAREGRRLRAYRDSVGVWTIGVGHTSAAGPPQVAPGLAITAAECDAIFARDVAAHVAAVRSGLTAPVGPHAFDALVSLCYNIGPSAFAGSTALRRINAGDAAGGAEAMLMWARPAAILGRRRTEAEQFVTPYAAALPRPTDAAARIRIAAPLAAVADPRVATPVLVPTAPRPARLARLRDAIRAWLAATPAAGRA
ncbi:lysozyme [Methylobacterium sp. WL12]|uniref:lysozyme n=1 Tax=Methylobacterium sp. WL12 TaxID=2603890 RepID=UPI0011CAD524|nr:lysozyme [Methylobacterium sp. WL12]TXM75666.1 lysozyme [Methylobacterium sp. WL12]